MTIGGRYSQRVTVQVPQVARAANGEETITWNGLFLRWAAVRALPGTEPMVAGVQRTGEQLYEVRLRVETKLRTMTTKWRLLTRDGSVLGIKSIAVHDGNRSELVLVCQDNGQET